ncbi:MAG TPA: hypothetical protein PK369_07650 [Thermoclostridium sp.]|nr:hypothetical protein [Thermoclostridium sp.]
MDVYRFWQYGPGYMQLQAVYLKLYAAFGVWFGLYAILAVLTKIICRIRQYNKGYTLLPAA